MTNEEADAVIAALHLINSYGLSWLAAAPMVSDWEIYFGEAAANPYSVVAALTKLGVPKTVEAYQAAERAAVRWFGKML